MYGRWRCVLLGIMSTIPLYCPGPGVFASASACVPPLSPACDVCVLAAGVTQVAAGDEYGCVLYTSGSAACFGYVPLYGNSQTLSGQLVISDVVVTNIKQVGDTRD